jgi:hypothetical protein
MIRARSFSVTTMGFADTLLPEFRSGVIGAPNGQIASWMNITERDGTLVVRDTPGCLWLFGAVQAAAGVRWNQRSDRRYRTVAAGSPSVTMRMLDARPGAR